jgi:hypothetical protein
MTLPWEETRWQVGGLHQIAVGRGANGGEKMFERGCASALWTW